MWEEVGGACCRKCGSNDYWQPNSQMPPTSCSSTQAAGSLNLQPKHTTILTCLAYGKGGTPTATPRMKCQAIQSTTDVQHFATWKPRALCDMSHVSAGRGADAMRAVHRIPHHTAAHLEGGQIVNGKHNPMFLRKSLKWNCQFVMKKGRIMVNKGGKGCQQKSFRPGEVTSTLARGQSHNGRQDAPRVQA